MKWFIIAALLLVLGAITYFGYYVFRLVMDPDLKLPFADDDIDDPNNVMHPTTRRHEEYRLKHLDSFNKLPFKTLTIKSFDGLNLYANLLEGENTKETVILVHGYKSSAASDFGGISKVY